MTAPMPSLHFYANDIDDLIRAVEERGVHPTETDVIVRAMKDLLAEAATAQREAREAQTYRANSEAEEMAKLKGAA